ncbi:PREDICTED: uncharacterized protein LOC109581046 [Amphimedon queenslandica]|nr:PREDICTED: uncharacterized protein LOC109581046 [Amphimedon queenslandica]|eukprot:XP_019850341.1 PREDICTED: uncharacterized protein LOC109581046 [Amphimedon queenslandica]
MASLKREGEDLSLLDQKPRKKRKAITTELPMDKLTKLLSKEDTVAAGLVYLFKEITEGSNSDLLTSYLGAHPDCSHVFLLMQLSTKLHDQDNILLCYLLLEHVLFFTASDKLPPARASYSSLGRRLVTTLLQEHMYTINNSLSSNKPDKLSATALKLLTVSVMQGKESVLEILDTFNFGSARLVGLVERDKEFQKDGDSVRVCFIKFALSFLVVSDVRVIAKILSLKKLLPIIFRKLSSDPPSIVGLFLQTLYDKVLMRTNIAKKDKLLLFDRTNIKRIVQLLQKEDQDESVKTIILDICFGLCDSSFGVAFPSASVFQNLYKTNNPVLLQLGLSLLSCLNEPKVHIILYRIISESPDLWYPFFTAAPLELDPKPTLKWLNQIKVVNSLLGILYPLDLKPFSISIDAFVSFVCPPVLTRSLLSNGIQNPCLLVKSKCLKMVSRVCDRISHYGGYQWKVVDSDKWLQYCDAVFSRLPNVKTLMSVRHVALQLANDKSAIKRTGDTNIPPDEPVVMMKNEKLKRSSSLLESLTSVLEHYQVFVPTILAQSQINVMKLLSDLMPLPHSKGDLTVLETLRLISNAPVEMLRNSVKGTDIKSLFQLSKDSELFDEASHVFVKCMQTNPCLLDYKSDLLLIFNIIDTHLDKLVLYSDNEKEELVDFIVHSVTEILKQSSLKYWSKQDTSDESVTDCSSSLCPLLFSFIDNCGRAPKVSRVLLLSDMILKLVHSSYDPVLAANTVLNRLRDTLLQYSTKGPIHNYLQLLHSHLWVWSSHSEKDPLEFKWYNKKVYFKKGASSDQVLMRECVFQQLVESTGDKGLVNLLKDTPLLSVTVSLLSVIPLSLPIIATTPGIYELLQKELGIRHTSNILWLQCLCTSSTTCSIKALLKNSPISNPICQKELKIEPKSSTQFIFISKQLLSLVRLASTYPSSKSMRKVSTFCVEYFLKFISRVYCNRKLRFLINSHLTDIASIHLKTTSADESSSFVLNSYACLAIDINSDFIDELFLSYLLSVIEHSKRPCTKHHGTLHTDTQDSKELTDDLDTTLTQGHSVASSNSCIDQDLKSSSLQLLLPLADQLREASATSPQSQYNSSLFNDLSASLPCDDNSCLHFNKDIIKRLWMYCSGSVSVQKMKIMSVLTRFCFIEDINNEFVSFCTSVHMYLFHHKVMPVDVSMEFLNLSKVVLLRNHDQVLSFYHIFTNIAPIFRDIVLNCTESEGELANACLESIKLCVSISPKVKKHLCRLLYRILVKFSTNVPNFHIKVIGCVLPYIGHSLGREMFLDLLKCLLKELRHILKRKPSSTKDYEERLSLLTNALSMALKNGPSDDDWLTTTVDVYTEIVHLWDKIVIKFIERHGKSDELVMELLSYLFSFIHIKSKLDVARPAVSVPSIHQTVWSLQQLGAPLNSGTIKLLVAIADNIIEDNTGHPDLFTHSQLNILVCNYTATLSVTDTAILYLMLCYEKLGVSISSQIPFLWGERALHLHELYERNHWEKPTDHEVLSMFNERRMLQSIQSFPYDRALQPVNPYQNTGSMPATINEYAYDPCFLLPIFSVLLSSTSSVFNCSSFIKRGLLSFVITATSSTCQHMRRAAYYNLSLFNHHLMNSNRFTERSLIMALMEILCNSVPEVNARLSVLTSSFFAKAVSLFVHTEEPMFPMVADYMIKKPFLDSKDIPLYSALVHTTKDEERSWVIELLCDGLKCSSDYQIYRKHSVLSYLMALYNSPLLDERSKSMIVNRLMSGIVDNDCALQDSCWNLNLLSWIHTSLPLEEAAGLLVRIASKFLMGEESSDKTDSMEPSKSCTSTGLTPPPFIKEEIALLLLTLMNGFSSQ